MANKLPWMKHDHNSRNDLFVKGLEDRYGHLGYSAWFKTLEVLHEHGVGDILGITLAQYAKEIGTKPSVARQFLASCSSSGKMEVSEVGKEVRIKIKNFRKKQANKHRQENSVTDLESGKPVLEGEEEGEGENGKLRYKSLVKDLLVRVGISKWSDADLEDARIPFGPAKGRRIMDSEPSRCQWYLDQFQMDAKTTAAMRHRIKIKNEECIK